MFCLVGWPDEASRNLYIKATQEIPLLQDTLCHIFVIGISKQHPINGRDIIDLVDVLVKRAAGLHPLIADDFQVCTDFQNYYRVLYKAKVLYTSVHCSMLIVTPRKVTLVNCHQAKKHYVRNHLFIVSLNCSWLLILHLAII